MIDKEELLKDIIIKYSWKKNGFGRYNLIFENISYKINSTSGSEKRMWEDIMQLFKEYEAKKV